MAVIDASVYVASINAHESEHGSSWTWFEQAKAVQEPVVAPVILLAKVSTALGRGVGGTGTGKLCSNCCAQTLPNWCQ